MKLLIVDDDKTHLALLKEVFESEGYQVATVPSGEEARKLLLDENFPLVLSDIRMKDISGLNLLSFIEEKKLGSTVILMTGFGNMEGAIEAIQKGAFDYISKPFKLEELKSLVRRAKEHYLNIEKENIPSTDKSGNKAKTLIGKSPLMVEVYKMVARATLSLSNVLIIGESGTGKELVARGIHQNSGRKTKPFVAINCGALTETLLESELFGHVKGAFTGAIQNKKGLLEEASDGTLFLDEIGDISLPLQVKLLRVLQEGDFKPVGSEETKKTSARVISATHQNLEQKIKDGSFREDLYYRLKVISIHLPPLRLRKEDIPELIEYFLSLACERTGKKVSHISEEALKQLQLYDWPGNIRELEHSIERAVALTNTQVLYPEDFSHESQGSGIEVEESSLEGLEKKHILKVLQETHQNKSKTAQILGIDRKTLHRKLEKYKIK